MHDITSKKIIVIEDETDIRVLYREILTGAGYLVHEAGDGNTGLDMMRKHDWDLVLLDIMLPGKDGMKILSEVQSNPAIKKGIIIALTNLNNEAVVKETFRLGIDGYLMKSEITPDKLVEEVQNYLTAHKAT